MQGDWKIALQSLLQKNNVCFLSTQGECCAETSMAPFALYEGDFILHLSSLAKHHANLLKQPKLGLMVCTAEQQGQSVLALPRLSVQAVAEPVENDVDAIQTAYLKAIPDAEPLLAFADFQLFRIKPSRIDWIGGFGKARKLGLNQWYNLDGVRSCLAH